MYTVQVNVIGMSISIRMWANTKLQTYIGKWNIHTGCGCDFYGTLKFNGFPRNYYRKIFLIDRLVTPKLATKINHREYLSVKDNALAGNGLTDPINKVLVNALTMEQEHGCLFEGLCNPFLPVFMFWLM